MLKGQDHSLASPDRISLGHGLWLAVGLVAIQAFVLMLMGQPPICACGTVKLWYGLSSGPETSQQLADWYTYTHVLHGFGFYVLLWLAAPRMPIGLRFSLAVGLEAGWEVIENTSFIIERYRQSALARGYFGDSIVNSLVDTCAGVLGFALARVFPVWVNVALAIAIELFLGLMIRDNLTLNIIQLIYPNSGLSTWQTSG